MEWASIYLFVATILLAVYLFFKWKFSYWHKRGIPTPSPSIPYGNFYKVSTSVHPKDLMAQIYKTYKGQTPAAGLYLTFSPMLVAIDLDLIKDVLIKDFNVFRDRGVYYNEKDDPLSAHMFALDGQKWKSIRTKLSPTFTSGKMKFMFPTVVKVADRFMDTLAEEIRTGNELEIKDLLARFTTDVIGECAFGIECNSLKDPNTEFRKYGGAVFTKSRNPRYLVNLMIQFPNVARKLGMKLVRDDVSTFFLGMVRQTVAYREKNNIRRNDFMDLLIDMKNGKDGAELGSLSIEEIAAQAFLFFLAGFETSSTTLSYTLYELALNPEVQKKARAEVLEILGKHNGQLTYEAMRDMHYIDQIISETLRKYPPVVALSRKSNEDFTIPNTKVVVEKGTRIAIPVYAIQHDPEIYPNPEVYDPDRFSPDEASRRHPMSFLSFGDGPRNCIGLRFGRMQSQIGLINLLKNFEIKKSPKTPIPLEFNPKLPILTIVGGLYLGIEKI